MNPLLISNMSDSRPFLLIGPLSDSEVHESYEKIHSASAYDLNISIQAALQRQYPELNLTAASKINFNFLRFVSIGNARAGVDISTDSVSRTRFFYNGSVRSGISDQLTEIK